MLQKIEAIRSIITMAVVPIISGLVHDISIVLYELMDGIERYRMSMVSKEWNLFCRIRILPIKSRHDVKKAIRSSDILWVLKYRKFIEYDNIEKFVYMHGTEEIIKIILDGGSDDWHNRFLAVCFRGDVNIFNKTYELNNHFIQYRKSYTDWSLALYYACKGGSMDIIKMVLSEKSDVDWGLWGACSGGHILIVQMMIAKGAVSLSAGLKNACKHGHLDVVDLLISRRVLNWNSGLYGACKGGHVAIAQQMIDRGANDWEYALYEACYAGHTDIISILVDKGANDWNFALQAACEGGHIEIVKWAIDRGADNFNDGFYTACDMGNVEIMQLMMNMGAAKCKCGKPIGSHTLKN